MSFKKGDRVVYIGGGSAPNFRFPVPEKEVLTIIDYCIFWPNSYIIQGYETDLVNNLQSFVGMYLRKVSDINDSREWAEKTLSEIEAENTIPAEIPQK